MPCCSRSTEFDRLKILLAGSWNTWTMVSSSEVTMPSARHCESRRFDSALQVSLLRTCTDGLTLVSEHRMTDSCLGTAVEIDVAWISGCCSWLCLKPLKEALRIVDCRDCIWKREGNCLFKCFQETTFGFLAPKL